MAKQVQIRKNEIPEGWSVEAADIINRVSSRKYLISKLIDCSLKFCLIDL